MSTARTNTNQTIFQKDGQTVAVLGELDPETTLIYCLPSAESVPAQVEDNPKLVLAPVFRPIPHIEPKAYARQTEGIVLLPLKVGNYQLKTVAIELSPSLTSLPPHLIFDGYDHPRGKDGQVFRLTSQSITIFSLRIHCAVGERPVYRLEEKKEDTSC
ncbi:MAG: hypothetical protein Q7S37_04375 [bacterium]|nr:hypothetical protein [bacterium]